MLCASVGSSALTLGRAKGGVLLGQPLRLTVPLQLEPEEGTAAQCLGADVFYGETRQDAARVEVTSESAQSRSVNVMVRAYANVDEPVVTVYLRAGCDQKASRRYVLLADLAQTGTAPSKPESVLPQASLAPPAAAIAAAALDAPSQTAPRPSTRARPTAVEPKADPVVPVRVKPRAQDIVVHRPHLKLAPVDLQEERDPTLRFSNDMALGDSGDLQQRAQAAAMWKSLNATPQDIERSDSRQQSLEKNLSALQDTTNKNRLLLQDLVGRLEKAESERYSNPLVFGLFGVLIICILGFAHAWTRLRRLGQSAGPWWRNDGADDPPDRAERASQAARQQGDQAKTQPPQSDEQSNVSANAQSEPLVSDNEAGQADIPIDGLSAQHHEVAPEHKQESSAPLAAKTSSPLSGHVDFGHSINSTIRSVNMQEMLDVRQQAEFFMTLGQHERAITVLRTIIDADSDANPLVYLDLLKILHDLGRKAEFEVYRTGFAATFSGRVPDYVEFNVRGDGLEAYPEVCHHIVTLWPSEEVIRYIEERLVRTEDQDEADGYSLEAFRDLLMLHGVARRIVTSFESGLMPFSAARTVSLGSGPGFDSDLTADRGFPDDTQPVAAVFGSNEHLSVDLDLTEPMGNLIDFDPDAFLPLAMAQRVPPSGG